jgi:aminotransferase
MANYAQRVTSFKQSSIDVMTAIALEHDCIMLAGGTPGFDAPEGLVRTAEKYLQKGHNQYTVNRGGKRLRYAIAEKWCKHLGRKIDPESEITITCGATEALLDCALALLDIGDKSVILEPFYENYRSISLLAGAQPVTVPLIPPAWEPDFNALEKSAIGAKLLIINTPHNPTGAVFSEECLRTIAEIAVRNDLFVISDETYRTMVFDGEEPKSIASLPGMAERTAIVSSFSKTMTTTGWRVGFFIAPAEMSSQIRKAHDFASICAPAPFQDAIAEYWLSEDFDAYFCKLMTDYRVKAEILTSALIDSGFEVTPPRGAYYILTDVSGLFPDIDDLEFCRIMARDVGVSAVGGRAFFSDNARARKYARFAFAQPTDVIETASDRIREYFTK